MSPGHGFAHKKANIPIFLMISHISASKLFYYLCTIVCPRVRSGKTESKQ